METQGSPRALARGAQLRGSAQGHCIFRGAEAAPGRQRTLAGAFLDGGDVGRGEGAEGAFGAGDRADRLEGLLAGVFLGAGLLLRAGLLPLCTGTAVSTQRDHTQHRRAGRVVLAI